MYVLVYVYVWNPQTTGDAEVKSQFQDKTTDLHGLRKICALILLLLLNPVDFFLFSFNLLSISFCFSHSFKVNCWQLAWRLATYGDWFLFQNPQFRLGLLASWPPPHYSEVLCACSSGDFQVDFWKRKWWGFRREDFESWTWVGLCIAFYVAASSNSSYIHFEKVMEQTSSGLIKSSIKQSVGNLLLMSNQYKTDKQFYNLTKTVFFTKVGKKNNCM